MGALTLPLTLPLMGALTLMPDPDAADPDALTLMP